MDADNSRTIDKEEALNFWAHNFPLLNTRTLFEQVDKNNDGVIQYEEFMEFWTLVLNSGYTEAEIEKEVDNIVLGGSWTSFKKKKGK